VFSNKWLFLGPSMDSDPCICLHSSSFPTHYNEHIRRRPCFLLFLQPHWPGSDRSRRAAGMCAKIISNGPHLTYVPLTVQRHNWHRHCLASQYRSLRGHGMSLKGITTPSHATRRLHRLPASVGGTCSAKAVQGRAGTSKRRGMITEAKWRTSRWWKTSLFHPHPCSPTRPLRPFLRHSLDLHPNNITRKILMRASNPILIPHPLPPQTHSTLPKHRLHKIATQHRSPLSPNTGAPHNSHHSRNPRSNSQHNTTTTSPVAPLPHISPWIPTRSS
jgi:hypothetical protein